MISLNDNKIFSIALITVLMPMLMLGYSQRASAYQPKAGKLVATTGPYFFQMNAPAPKKLTQSVGWGLIAEASVDDNGALEVGLIGMEKAYFIGSMGSEVGEKVERMYITTGYRRWFNAWTSSALSLYSAYSMGDPEIILTTTSDHSKQEHDADTLETSAHKPVEHGVDLSLQGVLWQNENQGFVFDLRFAKALTLKQKERSDHWSVSIGYQQHIPKPPR